MRQFQCVPTTSVFTINEFFTICFSLTNTKPLSFIQRNEYEEMNNFSCYLSCTWMTIIDCLTAYLEICHDRDILLNC